MKEYLSLVPGPTQVHPRVLQAMSQQVITHLNEAWRPFYLDTCEKMRKIYKTSGEVFLMASSGTGALESAVSSVVEPGQKILVLTNGHFGDRIAEVAKSYHMETEVLSFPTNKAIDVGALRTRLEKGLRDIAAVGAVYSESQNGILNPVREIAQACNEHDVPFIVDAVSALGGVEFDMDGWGVDIAISAGQKCLGGVVGMSMIAVNDKAWRYIEGKAGTGRYFNLNVWRNSLHNSVIHPHPWSMSETLVFGLSAACDLILEEGLEQRITRHWNLYDYYASELGKLGFTMFVPRECACPTVISINKHPNLSIEDLATRLKEEYGILIGVGIYEQRGKIWRIGNMAEQADIKKADRLIDSLTKIVGKERVIGQLRSMEMGLYM